jgi:hypothetical protein
VIAILTQPIMGREADRLGRLIMQIDKNAEPTEHIDPFTHCDCAVFDRLIMVAAMAIGLFAGLCIILSYGHHRLF